MGVTESGFAKQPWRRPASVCRLLTPSSDTRPAGEIECSGTPACRPPLLRRLARSGHRDSRRCTFRLFSRRLLLGALQRIDHIHLLVKTLGPLFSVIRHGNLERVSL